ncbi:hypothetical protein [Knoellia sp. LjRoot47]|uniref:hypothetical protein n=1 Tax=Knoellia sp. LjRoot47 TaxID=3342330 RepID=UPI003ECD3687
MDEELRDRALAHGGVIASHVMDALGVGGRTVDRCVREGSLERVRPGCFVLTEALSGVSASEAYRLRVAAVLLGRAAPGREPRGPARASHHAGLAVHGLPLFGCDLGVIDLACDVVHGSRQGLVRVHPTPEGDVLARVRGVLTSSVASCVVQTAAASGVTAGVVALDAALHERLVTLDAMRRRFDAMRPRYGARAVARTIELADPLCESPGETRTRLILRSLGMVYVAQAEIRAGGFLARVDFLVGRVVVEFDGAMKYAGAQGRDALVREKRREDELRRLGYEIVRLTWADLADPARVGRLIREAQARVSFR